MDNYCLPLVKCRCAICGNSFTCIKAAWRCKTCAERMRRELKRFDLKEPRKQIK